MPRKTIRVDLVARNIMTPDPITVSDTLPVSLLGKLLFENQISGAPVTDDTGALVGVVSQTDIIRQRAIADEEPDREKRRLTYHEMLDIGYFPNMVDVLVEAGPDEPVVGEICTPSTITCRSDMPVLDLLDLMVSQGVHRVIVIGKNKQPIGIVSSMDVMRGISEVRGAESRSGPQPA